MATKQAKGKRTGPAHRRTVPAPKKKFPVLPVVFAVLAALVVVAVVFTGGESLSDEERIEAAAGDVTVTGDRLDPFVTAAADPAVGRPAPVISGVDYDGATVTITPGDAPTVVLFLAHWCPHCQAEVPAVQEWLDATGGVPGVDLVSVTTVYRPAQGNWSPQDWLEGEGWDVPLIRDDTAASAYLSYGGGDFPYWVFLDGDGNVALRDAGQLPVAELEAIMLALSTT
jgi:thiol-disulfide isomerase/thioredoxin